MAQTSCVMQLCRGKDSAKKGYTKMSGGMAECNHIAQHSFAQQEFAREKSTKTRSSHMCHSTISRFFVGQMSVRSCDHVKQLFHIQLCKGLGGISWHEN